MDHVARLHLCQVVALAEAPRTIHNALGLRAPLESDPSKHLAGGMRRYHPHGRHDREVGEGARVEAAPADVPVQDEARPVLDVEQQRIGRVDIIADERIELV